MSRPKRDTEKQSPAAMRKALEADVQAYLATGKKIEQIPAGYTNQDPMGGRRHIVLGPKKKTEA